jgi:hypothetical protein
MSHKEVFRHGLVTFVVIGFLWKIKASVDMLSDYLSIVIASIQDSMTKTIFPEDMQLSVRYNQSRATIRSMITNRHNQSMLSILLVASTLFGFQFCQGVS